MNLSELEQQRIDKWIWHARITKTRTLAQKLIMAGNVRVNKTKITRPSYQIKPNDVLTISKNHRVSVLEIQALASRRGSASDANELYLNLNEDSKLNSESQIPNESKIAQNTRTARPNKRNRRKLRQLKTNSIESW